MEKTPEQKQAWIDGFTDATEQARSFYVRVSHEKVDNGLKMGASMVASMLERHVGKYKDTTQ